MGLSAGRLKIQPRRTMNEQGTRVLLIEDNPGDADLVRLRLVESQPDVKVDCVARLADALVSLDREAPTLVLLDLNLPDSRGSETVRRVREKVPNVPVVVLSGQDDESLALKAVHQGVQDYLGKGYPSSRRVEHARRYGVEGKSLWGSMERARKNQRDFKNK